MVMSAAEYCQQFGVPWIKALRMQPDSDILAKIAEYPLAQWHFIRRMASSIKRRAQVKPLIGDIGHSAIKP
jgi:hypothetical protein